MAEPPPRRSALAAAYCHGPFGRPGDLPGVTLCERHPLEMCQVAAWADDDAPSLATALAASGIALPPQPNKTVSHDRVTALWTGPGRWLVVAPEGARLGDRLHAAVSGRAALTELGHARTVLRIGGGHARDLLAKGTGLDLHPGAFAAGDCAQTLFAHAAVLLHAVDGEAIDLYLPRSYALTVWEWLLDAAAEFGGIVLPAAP